MTSWRSSCVLLSLVCSFALASAEDTKAVGANQIGNSNQHAYKVVIPDLETASSDPSSTTPRATNTNQAGDQPQAASASNTQSGYKVLPTGYLVTNEEAAAEQQPARPVHQLLADNVNFPTNVVNPDSQAAMDDASAEPLPDGYIVNKVKPASLLVSKPLSDTTDHPAETAKDTASKAAESTKERASNAAQAAQDKAPAAVDSAKEGASNAAGYVQDKAPAAADYAKDTASSALEATKQGASNAAEYVHDNAPAATDSAKKMASSAAESTKQGASDAAKYVQVNAPAAADSAKQTAAGAQNQAPAAGGSAKSTAASAAEATQEGLSNAAEAAGSAWAANAPALGEMAQDAGESISDAAASTGHAAYEASGPSGQKIADGAQQMGAGVVEVAGAAWNASAPTVSAVGSSVGQAASSAGAWVSDRASDAYNVSAPVVADAAHKAGDMASSAGSWIANKTSAIFGGSKSQALTVKLNDRDLLDVQAQSDAVTVADTSSPPPPPGTSDAKTAVRAVIRVVGADVDPFNTQKQSDLLSALLSVMTTVTSSSARILYVAKVYPTSGRRLLSMQEEVVEMTEVGQPSRRLLVTASTNQADVNFQLLAFTTANVPVVQAELANVIKNSTGTDNALPTALQNMGHDHWGVTLESSVAAEPVTADFKPPCQNYFGSICLDGSGLSASAVKGIIAGGVIGVVLAIALLWCAWDVYHRRKKVYGMDETPKGAPDAIHGERAVTGATALPHAKAAQVNAPNRGFWSRTFGGGGNQAVAPPSVPIQVAAQGAPAGSMTAAPHGYAPPSITPAPRP